MDFIEEIQKAVAKAKTPEQAEEKVVELINKTDFSDSAIKQQSIIYIQDILENYIALNKPITSLQAKTMHCILCKQALTEQGVPDIKITYRKEGGSPCFRDDRKCIDFCDNPEFSSVCSYTYLLKPYCKDIEKSEKSRLAYIARCIADIEHEARHAVQFIKMMPKTLDEITPRSYLMAKQHIARMCSDVTDLKYNKNGLNAGKLYLENHEQFLYEVDAYYTGFKRALEKLKILSPKAYNVAITQERFGEKLNNWNINLESYNDIEWQHDTNPTDTGVKANHKASLIIDTILPNITSSHRKYYFQNYPTLHLTYNHDGSKKSLEQVEREREANINRILVTGTPEDVKKKVPKIIQIYETAIESDPVLSFERCMKQIAMLSWDGTRHYTNGVDTLEEKYDHAKVMAELKATTEKAKKLASYIEDSDYKIVKRIFSKCKRDLETSKKTDIKNSMFYGEKKLAMFKIKKEIMTNRDFKSIEENDRKIAAQKKMAQMQAEEIIKKVFPNFTPQNIIFESLTNGSLFKETNNVEQKLLLEESYKRYVKDLMKSSGKMQGQSFVTGGELLTAIKNYYNFEVTDEQRLEFERKLKNGEIKTLKNIYSDDGYSEQNLELLPHKTTTVEPEKQEENKQTRPKQTTTFKPKEEKKHKDEEEYDEYGIIKPKKNQTTKKLDDQTEEQEEEQKYNYHHNGF